MRVRFDPGQLLALEGDGEDAGVDDEYLYLYDGGVPAPGQKAVVIARAVP